jgi:hypothetical protein
MGERDHHVTIDEDRQLLGVVEDLRVRFTEIDAYATAMDELFHRTTWPLPRERRRDFNQLSCLITTVSRAVQNALGETDKRLSTFMRRRTRDRRRTARL